MKLTTEQQAIITAAIERSPPKANGKPAVDTAALAEELGLAYSLAKRMLSAALTVRRKAPAKAPTQLAKALAAVEHLMAEYGRSKSR